MCPLLIDLIRIRFGPEIPLFRSESGRKISSISGPNQVCGEALGRVGAGGAGAGQMALELLGSFYLSVLKRGVPKTIAFARAFLDVAVAF